MLPPAPGLFSAITCWPSALVSWSAMTRARMSVDWPGGKGTMMRIGLVGHCWAPTGIDSDAATEARKRRRLSIGICSQALRRLVLLRRMLAGDLQEILQNLVAVLRGDALGMELHAMDGQRPV